MAKKGPGMLDVILAAQKEKMGGEAPSVKSLEDALSNVGGTISIADFKKLLAGGTVETPASNVIDIAQDIKNITENTSVEKSNSEVIVEILENQAVDTKNVSEHIEKIEDTQKSLEKTPEEKAEEIKLFREQNDILNQIEENTRAFNRDTAQSESVITQPAGGSGFLSGLLGFLGGGLAGGLTGLFAGGAAAGVVGTVLMGGITSFIGTIFKSLLKGSIITMLVGGLISGIVDFIQKYKESGDFAAALWEGFSGFTEFITFGLIDKEKLDKIAENIKKEWERFYNDILGFMDAITSFVTDMMPESIKNIFKKVGTEVSSAEHINKETGKVDYKISKTKGELQDENTLTYHDKEYKITDRSYDIIKKYMDKGDYTRAEYFIKTEAIKEDAEVRKELSRSKAIADIKVSDTSGINELTGEPYVIPAQNNTADTLVKKNEENAQIQQNNMSLAAPNAIYAPTTNSVTSQTNVAPTIKSRNDEPSATKYNSPGSMAFGGIM